IHLNKSRSSNPLVRICGSVAFGAAARSVLLVGRAPDTENSYVLAHAKSNYAPRATSRRYNIAERWVGESLPRIRTSAVMWGNEAPDVAAEDLLRERGRGSEKVGEAAAFLAQLLAGGPMAEDEVKRRAEKKGISAASLRRAKKKLEIESHAV